MQSVDGGEKVIHRDVMLGFKHVFRVTVGASSVLRIHHSQTNFLLPSSKTLLGHTTHSLLPVYYMLSFKSFEFLFLFGIVSLIED